MKKITHKKSKGFTLAELLVAMFITTILLTVLISAAASSGEVLAKAKSKAELSEKVDRVFSILESDIESMLVRRDDKHWFYAGLPYDTSGATSPRYLTSAVTNIKVDQADNEVTNVGPYAFPSVANMVFYTAVVDSYDGVRNDNVIDQGGDVSMVEYQLDFSNMFNEQTGNNDVDTDVSAQLFRWIEFPDNVFGSLDDARPLIEVFNTSGSVGTVSYVAPDKQKTYSVLSTNVYSINATFNVSYIDTSGATEIEKKAFIALTPHESPGDYNATTLGIGPNGVLFGDAEYFFTGGSTSSYFADSSYQSGISSLKIESVNLTITLLDNAGIQYLDNVVLLDGTGNMNRSELIAKHGHVFSRTIDFPDY